MSRFTKSILLFLFLSFLLTSASAVFAETQEPQEKCGAAMGSGSLDTSKIRLSVYIPGITEKEGACYYLKGALPEYIAGLYNFGLAIGGFLAVLMVMIGGAQWVTAGGAADKITRAKERILNAIVGLIILLLSFTILHTVNPQLTKLKKLNVKEAGKQSAFNLANPANAQNAAREIEGWAAAAQAPQYWRIPADEFAELEGIARERQDAITRARNAAKEKLDDAKTRKKPPGEIQKLEGEFNQLKEAWLRAAKATTEIARLAGCKSTFDATANRLGYWGSKSEGCPQ